MSYRFKNSDFKLFLGFVVWKSERFVSVCREECIGVYFWIFLSGKSVPGGGEVEVSRNYLLTD